MPIVRNETSTTIRRGDFLKIVLANIAFTMFGGQINPRLVIGSSSQHRTSETKERSVEEWMDEWMKSKTLRGPLHLSRFVEPVYFLTQPICWEPDSGRKEQKGFPVVQAPVGFVTDLASIPQVFWNILRPDGDYTYPAILHDFMYWTQTHPRHVADSIFKYGMEYLKINAVTIATIYNAVRAVGGHAWASNVKLKGQGEMRLLKTFPQDPTIRWAEWKKRQDVFHLNSSSASHLERCPLVNVK